MEKEAINKAIELATGGIRNACNDLNAMHESEKVLNNDQREEYAIQLVCTNETSSSRWDCAHATAAQRAEAFLRTLNLWEEE